MEVILIKDVDNLGSAHELVAVRPGYARNFLIPQKYAVEANASNKKMLAERQKVLVKREEKLIAEIAQFSNKLSESAVTVGAKTGTSGKIFGSVTPIQIVRAIREQKGYEIDRKKVTILEEVKELGTYKAQINFGADKVVDFSFEVVGE